MGTRADFYVGRGESAEWIGSIAWDGYPEGIPDEIKAAADADAYRAAFRSFVSTRDDATLPEQGWPWPWETSGTTDFAYALDGGVVYASCFGATWHPAMTAADHEWDDESVAFPDMGKEASAPPGSRRSGLTMFKG